MPEDKNLSLPTADEWEFPREKEEQVALEQIFQMLLRSRRVDFTHYRQSTVMRRLFRRMSFSKHSTFGEYLDFMRKEPGELNRLYDDLLLSFTEFFRDPHAFERLKQTAFSSLLKNHSIKSPVRIWVPGCSTGEEVYSLAICLTEFFEESHVHVRAHLFGTDLAEQHIEAARAALYPEKIRKQMSKERLERFFDVAPEGFRVAKHIREMCVFAAQDVTQDPPLPRIDLVSCRNVLIYFDASFQDVAIPLFHFALKPSGYLWLGSSESLGRFPELFRPVDKKLNLFAKRASVPKPLYRFPLIPPSLRAGKGRAPVDADDQDLRQKDIGEAVDRYLLKNFTPTGVLVDGHMQIRRFLGRTSPYVEPADGEASLKLSHMAKDGLMPDLYVAIEEARKKGAEVNKRNVTFSHEGEVLAVNITVVPLREKENTEPSFLILFKASTASSTPPCAPDTSAAGAADDVLRLTEELRIVKEHLQSIIEEKDAVNQDLWAANEEVQSTNEELQSVNEELEAAKEELESSNEELIALNEELRAKNIALAESEDKFRRFLENARDIYFQYNLKKGRFDYISPAVMSILGYTPEEFADRWRQIELSSPGEAASITMLKKSVDEAMREGKTDLPLIEARYRHKDGRAVWLAQSGRVELNAKGVPVAVNNVARDITARKAAADALAVSERRFKGVFDNTGSGVAIYEAVGDGKNFMFVDFNHAAERLEQISKEEVIGRLVTDVFPDAASFNILAVLRRVWQTGVPEHHPEITYKDNRIDGWRNNYVFCLSSSEVVTVYEDLTAQKQAEEALRESEARWQFAVDGNGLGLWDWNNKTGDMFFSEQWKKILGYAEDEIRNRLEEWKSRVHPGDIERVQDAVQRHLSGEAAVYISEYRMKCRDGSYKWILARGKAVTRDEAGDPVRVIGTHADVTEQRQMEEQLRQSEKMQAVGQLAGGIAHDFNNQLAAILGYADLLREELLDNRELCSYADNIILGIKRASDLTAQLLAFARKGKYLSVPVDMHRIVFEVVNLLRHSIDKRIEIQQLLKASPSTTLGDPTQLQNAMLNLALNARDAMPDGGELIFATEVVELPGSPGGDPRDDFAPGRYLQVSIIDSGIGIAKDVLPKIFEPFFTTKAPGSGTGMGLAAVYGTAKNHRGSVTVSSEEGVGSTFRLLLPLLEEQSGRAADEVPSLPCVEGCAHILLVDDEQAVCDVTSQLLERLGYRVTVCRNGKEAVDFYKAEGKEVDLVILDVVMPTMGGRETFSALKKLNPKVKVLLSSGYSLSGEAQCIMDKGAEDFIQKPFRKSELSLKVSEILSKRRR